jgi:hypothetical protein
MYDMSEGIYILDQFLYKLGPILANGQPLENVLWSLALPRTVNIVHVRVMSRSGFGSILLSRVTNCHHSSGVWYKAAHTVNASQ